MIESKIDSLSNQNICSLHSTKNTNIESIELNNAKRAVCIMSGGIDSALCAYIAKNQGFEIIALHFDYDQRTQTKERECFYALCNDLKPISRVVLNCGFIAHIGGNSLTSSELTIRKNFTDIRDGREIPNTYVPFRNGIFLSIASALAEKEQCEAIFIGVVQEDSSGYPDCTHAFIDKMQAAVNEGRGDSNTRIFAPLLHKNKCEIIELALEHGVPLSSTWSCYESQDLACGLCDSCILRLDGFKMAGKSDPIVYRI